MANEFKDTVLKDINELKDYVRKEEWRHRHDQEFHRNGDEDINICLLKIPRAAWPEPKQSFF